MRFDLIISKVSELQLPPNTRTFSPFSSRSAILRQAGVTLALFLMRQACIGG
jgi:hypothetical protein